MILRFFCCLLTFVQISCSVDLRRAKLVSHHMQRIVIPPQQQQQQHQQHNIKPIIYEKEIYFFEDSEDKTETTNTLTSIFQNEPNYVGTPQNYQTIHNTIPHKTDVHFNSYRYFLGAPSSQPTIANQYGINSGNKRLKHYFTSTMQGRPLTSIQQYGSGNKNLQTRSFLSENTPVSKNYAMNFLPTGIDVVPGSSYIPLVK